MRGRGVNSPSAGSFVLYIIGFFACVYIGGRIWHSTDNSSAYMRPALVEPEIRSTQPSLKAIQEVVSEPKLKPLGRERSILEEVAATHDAIKTLDKTISSLEMELAAARASNLRKPSKDGSPGSDGEKASESEPRQKVLVVVGINTAFSSKKRRDSVRNTWMPQGEKLEKLEKEKGIVMRFVIGHSAPCIAAPTSPTGMPLVATERLTSGSTPGVCACIVCASSATPGGILDRAIEAEEAAYHDILRLDHVEGYHELSAKTKIYFSTAVAKWDADFYVKVDDDVHVNVGMLASTLARHRPKPRVYIGCMKSGPVLAQQGVKYHEPEFWKFGEEGNKYFRHATGQIYALSKDLATYISINQAILHRYANEDVSLGSWFIGLDVEHIDDRSMCCSTPPDCEWKAQAGNMCVASFDWTCSGICKSVDRMKDVHQRCGEGDEAVWSTSV
eukprot:jgi/Mesen1/7599/ME000395S06753